MYKIECGGELVYNPEMAARGYIVLEPKIDEELNKAASFSYTLPPTHPALAAHQKLKPVITVYEDEENIYSGRIINSKCNFHKLTQINCEGELAFLNDSIMRYYDYHDTPERFFKMLIDNHNSMVDDKKKFAVGNVTTADSNDYIYRAGAFEKTLDIIKNKLINITGGYVRIRHEGDIRYIDYLTDYGDYISQPIKFGYNMLDLSDYITAEDIYTAIIPTGKDGVTIEAANKGIDYIVNDTAVALFGKIWCHKKWPDVSNSQTLYRKAKADLDSNIEMSVTLTANAVDMSKAGIDIDKIKLGDYVRVISPPHGIDSWFKCSKITKYLFSPDKNIYTFGYTTRGITERQLGINAKVEDYYYQLTKKEEGTE